MERKGRIHEFHIVSNVAYDYMEIEEELISLMDKAKVVCFTVPFIFLTGLRRVGKTTLFNLFIKYPIEEEKINPARIFYISLDDYLFSQKNILELVEESRKIQKISFRE